MDRETFGNEVAFPSNGAALEFWCEISCDDEIGLAITGIEEGDKIHISSISGIGSFESGSLDILAGFVAIAGGILQDGTSYYTDGKAKETEKAIGAQAQKLEEALSDLKSKHRDGYGQDPSSGHFGKNEGGVIVCMPNSHGAVYATNENHFKGGAKNEGRLPEYYSQNITDLKCWFPSRVAGGKMDDTADMGGEVHILAFDSKFSDNAGTYTVKVKITRPTENDTHEELVERLDSLSAVAR